MILKALLFEGKATLFVVVHIALCASLARTATATASCIASYSVALTLISDLLQLAAFTLLLLLFLLLL